MSLDHTAPAAQFPGTQFPGAPFPGGAGALPVQHPEAPPRRSRVLLTIGLSVAALVCAVFVALLTFLGSGPGSVPGGTVGATLTPQLGAPVSCSQDLPAEIGASITCTATDVDGVHHVLVTATSLEGSDVHFHATVQD